MTTEYQSTLRERLIARRNHPVTREPLKLPLRGLIPADEVAHIHHLASLAKVGDVPARDLLYASLQPRLQRMGYVVRPWPNTPGRIGVWDRDDVDQEGWFIFVELLGAWNDELPFVAWLFARFPWRLRDRILRGIGKPLPPLGDVRVPEHALNYVLYASDSDQPESALMARRLLEHLLGRVIVATDNPAELQATLSTLHSPPKRKNKDKVTLPDDGRPRSGNEAA